MKKFILLILSIINAIITSVYIAMSPLDIIPSHYNIYGEVDAYSSKWFAIFTPCILIVFAIIYLLRCIYAKKNKSEDYNEKLEFKIALALFVFLLVSFWYLNIVTISGSMNISNSLIYYILFGYGGILIYLSNMFGKTKQNRFFGIRISSTLNSKYVWKKTHRLAGYMGVIAGVIMITLGLISLFVSSSVTSYLIFVSFAIYLLLGIIVPIVYSYIIYGKEKSQSK